MLTSERKSLILQVLQRERRLVAKSFSHHLGVSEDTIRRDLRELAGEGKLQRVHGGALPASPATVDFAARERLTPSTKAQLGRAGALMIVSGQIVFLDGGTTNVQLARHLPENLHATVVTHSPSIAVELARHPHIDVELIGGRLFKHSIVTVGAASAEAIARVRADIYFMGATGLHPEIGVSTGDAEEAAIKRLIARQSAETVILATTEKLGAVSPYSVLPIPDVGTLVVERDLPADLLDPFRFTGVSVMEVPA